MIIIKNRQKKIPINSKVVRDSVEKLLILLRYKDFDLGISFVSDDAMKKYNRDYRNIDKTTDVLSFPFYPDLKAGQRIKPKSEEEKNLGDLILAPNYIKKQAEELNISFEQRINVLLVHGICHLLGYDHVKDEDYIIMHRKELSLLRKLRNI